jgi:magnesium transporter
MENQFDETRDFQSEIKELILQNNQDLVTQLEEYHLYDISRVVLELTEDEAVTFFNTVKDDFSATIFEFLEADEAYEICKVLSIEKIVKIIENMELDDAVDLLKYLNKQDLNLINRFNTKKRKELIKLMAYKEDQIGAFMSDSFLTLEYDFTVKEAMNYVTKNAHEVDYISILYIIKEGKLAGYIRLKDLIVARKEEMIKDVMETRFVKILPTDDKEEVSQIMQDISESSIPIVNDQDQLVGIITHDDLMDIVYLIEEEDYTKFAAISDSDIDLESGKLKNNIKARLPWLTILLGLSMITTIILSFFEKALSDVVILSAKLAVYLPLILGMAGNTGTQSLAVMIRYLTKNEEVDKKGIRNHLFRELRTGIFQGLIIGVLIFLMIIITSYISKEPIDNQNLIYATVTASSIFIALIVSTTLGAVIPLGMNALKIDPAVASGPFITTVSDIITLSIYYSVSLAILLPMYI